MVARASNGTVTGWAALAPVPDTGGTAGVAEVSVYVTAVAHGNGIAMALLERLISESEAADYWTLQAQIMAENAASLGLHRKAGFRDVGIRERYG